MKELYLLRTTYYVLRTAPSRVARQGQVMVLTVLALGGTILGATTIAGLLMLYQVRQATDLGSSARAIFAADAGMEQSFFNLFCKNDDPSVCPNTTLSFTNGAKVEATCYDAADAPLADCHSDQVRSIRSVGTAGNATRAFEANF